MTFSECFPVLGKKVSHMSVHLMLPLCFYQHGPPLKLMQEDVLVFGHILGSNRAPATPRTLFLAKNIPGLACISFIIGYGKTLHLSVSTSMVYACGH